MAKKRKTGSSQDVFRVNPETVAELRELCSSFTKILDNTGINAHEMQGDLGRLLDVYISLCCLTSELALKTDKHIGKLFACHYPQAKAMAMRPRRAAPRHNPARMS